MRSGAGGNLVNQLPESLRNGPTMRINSLLYGSASRIWEFDGLPLELEQTEHPPRLSQLGYILVYKRL